MSDYDHWEAVDDADRADLHANRLQEEVDALKAGRDAVLDLHQPPDGDDPASTYCAHDDCPWPCPTARALGITL